MIRKLMLLSTALFALYSESVHGLGLGDLKLNSALNQEFSAEIRLTNLRGLGIDEILPNLASADDFRRVGVERTYVLTDLRFKVQANDQGELSILITSTRPIIEPYLNFIVEVLWPSGRILREYTVLLDPPVFGEQGVEPIAVGRTQTTVPTERTAAQPRARAAAPRVADLEEAEPAAQVGEVAGDDYGVTGPGDTLWAIALKVRPDSSVSAQQTMLAIQKYNPNAFINNNINLLMAGYVLRIPTLREIEEVSLDSAVREVQIQNEDWQAGRTSVAQLDASSRRAERREASTGPDGELKLLAADSSEGERAGGGGDSARNSELENELSIALEDLDRVQRANTELNVKLDDVAAQVDTLNKLVQLKDDQIAALQAQLIKLQDMEAVEPPPPPATTSVLGMLSSPLVYGPILFILVGGVAGGLFVMKRKRSVESSEEEEPVEISPEQEETTVAVEPAADDVEDLDELADVVEEDEDVSPQTSDVLGEVDIYIAYGRFPQAINFLQTAIESEPQRTDIRLKLLEVFTQTEDTAGFNLQFEELKAIGDEQATQQATEMQAGLSGAKEEAEAAMGATAVSSDPVAAVSEGSGDDDFNLDLDEELDLDGDAEELDIDLDLDEGDEDSTELDLDLDDDEAELDLDLDLDGDEAETDSADEQGTVTLDTPVEEASSDDDDLDLDLGDDDELDLDLEDGGELDLDLDADDDELELSLDAEDEGGEAELSLDDDSLDLDLEDEGGDAELSLDDDDSLDLDLEDEGGDAELSLDDDDSLDLDLDDQGGEAELSLDDDSLDLDLEDEGGETELSLDDDDSLDLDLEDERGDAELSLDDDSLDLDLEDEGGDAELSLDDDDSLDLDLEDEGGDAELSLDDDSLDLDLEDEGGDAELSLDDDSLDLDLEDEGGEALSLDDEDGLDLSLDDDLDLESASTELGETTELSLDDDDDATIVPGLGEDDDDLDLSLDDDDATIVPGIGGDDDDSTIVPGLGEDDDDLDLSLDDEDGLDLDLDLEEDNKLDLARAYIDMGDTDGAKSLLEEVLKEGTDSEQQEATGLLESMN
jgi:pilus assembly protein FimV